MITHFINFVKFFAHLLAKLCQNFRPISLLFVKLSVRRGTRRFPGGSRWRYFFFPFLISSNALISATLGTLDRYTACPHSQRCQHPLNLAFRTLLHLGHGIIAVLLSTVDCTGKKYNTFYQFCQPRALQYRLNLPAVKNYPEKIFNYSLILAETKMANFSHYNRCAQRAFIFPPLSLVSFRRIIAAF